MRSAHPKGQFGVQRLSPEDQAALENLIRNQDNLQHLSGLRHYRRHYRLPSGAVATFYDSFGTRRAIVTPPEEAPPEGRPGTVHVEVPTFFSGEVTEFTVYPQEGVAMRLTECCRRRLESYSGQLAPQRLRLQRFVIEYPKHLQEFPHEHPFRTVTQYAQGRATWWSGRMAAVVQTALGYGIHDFDRLPDAPYEKAKLQVPQEVAAQMAAELGLGSSARAALLPACTGWPVKSGQIQFDYKANRTEGVAFGADKMPWLVRIAPGGTFAMPLPIVPATRTAAFRRWIEQVGDAEIKWLLDTFGGMPSGEGFPPDEQEFAAWRRAGVIIRLGGRLAFHDAAYYSPQIGWSFNNSGNCAVNTCWGWGDDGLKRGYAWTLHFRIGQCLSYGQAREVQIPPGTSVVFIERAQRYIRMVEQAAAQAVQDGDALMTAALYAFRRAPFDDIMSRAANANARAEEELQFWHEYEAQPIASGWCAQHQLGEGILYSHLKPKAQPQIKFPEVAMGGCISFDFSKDEDAPAPNPDPKCNTIMHAYYIGDDMKWVKYFRDESEAQPRVQRSWSNGDELAVGSWEETVTLSPEKVHGSFYTTDFDERTLTAERSRHTKTVGKDLGFDRVPFFSFYAMFDMRGDLWRYRYAQHDSVTVESENYRMETAICVPYLAPHGALHAWRETDSGQKKTTSRRVAAFLDPHSYTFWTYHSVFAWRGGLPEGQTYTYKGEFQPSPYEKRKGYPVWANGYSYDAGGSSFADQGQWLGALPQDVTAIVHPNENEWKINGGGTPPGVREFSRTEYPPDIKNGKVDISLAPQPQNVHHEMPDRWYFEISPDEFGGVFYRDAVRVEAGNIDYCNCSEVDSHQVRYHWGRNELADSRAAHCFIGVFAK